MKRIWTSLAAMALLLSLAGCVFVESSPATEPTETSHTCSWGRWYTTKAPTETTEGTAKRACSVCAKKETMKLDKLIPSEGLEFTLNDDETGYILTGIGTCTDSHIIIPLAYNEKPVTAIGTEAFYFREDVAEVTIPDGVTAIGDRAFFSCYDLRNITIGSSVRRVGDSAFANCVGLVDVVFPEGLTYIGDNVFYGCNSLMTVSIPDSITHIGEAVFYGCKDLQLNEYDNAYYLGNAVNPYLVLYSCKSHTLTDCTIHTSTQMIHHSAFAYCSDLTTITIPNSVTHIGNSAFYSCRSLTDITVGSGVTNIGSGGFVDCTALMDITVDSGNPVYHSAGNCIIETATKTLFAGCKASIIPSDGSVTAVGAQAFWYCTALSEITVPSGVTSIDVYAFQNCTGLTSITIAESVASIGDKAFERCHALKNITFEGTIEQWKAIKKGPTWDYPTGYYTIYCVDGEIEK